MMIYQLLLFSCLTSNDLNGDFVSKTCRWTNSGLLYVSETKCRAEGRKAEGTKVLSFYKIVGAEEFYEKYKCSGQAVVE